MSQAIKKLLLNNSIETAEIIKKLILNSTDNLNYRLLVEVNVFNKLESFPSDIQVLEQIFNYAKSKFSYVRDIQTTEYIKTPDRIYNEILLNNRFFGDCDDSTVFIGCLLINAGFTPVIRLAKFNNEESFSHIYCYTFTENNQFVCMDIANRINYFIDEPYGISEYFDIIVEE